MGDVPKFSRGSQVVLSCGAVVNLFSRHVRNLVLDILRERLFAAGALLLAWWMIGGTLFWTIGRIYGVNSQLVAPDGTLDHANFGFLNCMYLASMAVTTMGFADLAMLNRVPEDGRDVMYTCFMVYSVSAYVVGAYATAQIVGYVVEGALGRYLEKRRMERDLKTVADHFVVCGLGSTGLHIVSEVTKVRQAVVGVDCNPDRVAEAKRRYPDELFLVGDCTQDDVLVKAGVSRAAGLFCAVASDNDNIIAALSARHINSRVRIVGRAVNLQNIDKLRQVGADAAISPNHIGGMRMASEMLRPAVVTFLDTMLRSRDSTFRFENVSLEPGGAASSKTLGDFNIATNLGLAVVAVVQPGGAIQYNPGPQTRVQPGDSLVVIASPEQRKALDQLVNRR